MNKIQKIRNKLRKLKKEKAAKQVAERVRALRSAVEVSVANRLSTFRQELIPLVAEINDAFSQVQKDSQIRVNQIYNELGKEIDVLSDRMDDPQTKKRLDEIIAIIEAEIRNRDSMHLSMEEEMATCMDGVESLIARVELLEESGDAKDLASQIQELRNDFLSRISLAGGIGGGNANRNIAVGGNTSVLSTYTDINIKPGSNVTLTYTNNPTTKYLDLTIAATGGSGTSRNISTVSVSSVLADTAATDIVVIANQGVQLTLPTAVSNTNLYTIKNTSTSSVLVNTTGGQTIDGDSNIILQVQYTAVDLISDNANWQIT